MLHGIRYWPGIKGRGEYVRLMFEEAGISYVDVGVKDGEQQQSEFNILVHA